MFLVKNSSLNYYFSNEREPLIWQFSSFYSLLHGWLSLFVCSTGLVFNMFTVLVLRKTSTESAAETNFILITLALSDSFTMITYIPYCVYYYIIYSNSYFVEPFPERDNIFWTIYSIFHLMSSVTFHTISVWVTVYLAFYRYIYMSKSVDSIKGIQSKEKQACVQFLLSKCTLTIFIIITFSVFVCIPIYLYPSLQEIVYSNSTELDYNVTIYKSVYIYYIDASLLDKLTNGSIYKLMLYSQAVFAKILPCVLLVIFVSLLVRSLLIVKENSKRLSSIKRSVSFMRLLKKKLVTL